MLNLIPFEETRAGQECIEIGMERGMEIGMKRGMERGMEQGLVLCLQQTLLMLLTAKFEVSRPTVERLVRRLDKEQLNDLLLFTIKADRYEQIEQWVQESSKR